MDASCGPTSAVSQLSKHTQRDTSLQHEVIRQGHGPSRSAFRNQPGLDTNLNREFHQFQGRGMEYSFQGQAFGDQKMNGDFAGQFHGQSQPGQRHNQISQHLSSQHMDIQQHVGNQQWVKDFNGLSINQNSQIHKQTAQPQTNWSLQFLQHTRQHNMSGQGARQDYSMQPMLNPLNLQMTYQDQQGFHQSQDQSSHFDSQAFDDQFEKVSREIDELEQMNEVENVASHDDTEKIQFAEAARRVQTHMTSASPLVSSETASKFQQSNFLKLMTQISNREVEVNMEGDKLVTKESGEDVRKYLSDPLKEERLNYETRSESSQPVFTPKNPVQLEGVVTNESANVRSHLPDPLAHIKDGQLLGDLTPLQAARVISGGQVRRDDWFEDESWGYGRPQRLPGLLEKHEQEVYDDYRNDDDSH